MDVGVKRVGFVNGKFPTMEETRVHEFHRVIPFDALYEAFNDRGFANGKWGFGLEVEGTNGGEVGFNGLGLKRAGAKMCDPLHDAALGSWEAGMQEPSLLTRVGRSQTKLMKEF